MLHLFFCDVYYFLDPGSTFSYVTLCIDVFFGFDLEINSYLFSVSTPVKDSIIVERV